MPSGGNPQASNSDYDYTDRLIRRDWAWEFLRRNPVFRNVHARATKFAKIEHRGNLSTIELPHSSQELKELGCILAAAPDTRAPRAWAFWEPSLCPEVTQMVALDAGARPDSNTFDLDAVKCRTTLLSTPDGQHLLFQEGSQSLQFAVSGVRIDKPVRLLSEAIVPADVIKYQLRALQCFQHLLVTGHLLPNHCAIEPQAPRLRTVLQALDGSLAGASHREIACSIFGSARVDRDWDNPGRHLQDQVRRAIRRGRDLMEGGYLRLLR